MTGYRVAVVAAYAVVVLTVATGIPITTLIVLLTIPLALQVSRGSNPTTTTRTA